MCIIMTYENKNLPKSHKKNLVNMHQRSYHKLCFTISYQIQLYCHQTGPRRSDTLLILYETAESHSHPVKYKNRNNGIYSSYFYI